MARLNNNGSLRNIRIFSVCYVGHPKEIENRAKTKKRARIYKKLLRGFQCYLPICENN